MALRKKARFLAQSAVIAALYAVLTYVSASLNLAYGAVQFRFSEALTLLAVFTPAAIPGLTFGCFLANMASPLGVIDCVLGSAATAAAAVCTYFSSKVRFKNIPALAALPPVVSNAVFIGFELACLSGAGVFDISAFSVTAFFAAALPVAVSEAVVCFGLGLPLVVALQRAGADKKIFK